MPARREVHIWRARLDLPAGERGLLQDILDADERKRAQSFVRELDRRRYIAGRGLLRRLLASYLGIKPEEVIFAYGAYGKPQLAPPLAESGLKFNLSHAGARALYAIAHHREVGIDLEPRRRDVAWWQLAPLVFSTQELAELAATPAPQKLEAFLRGWTRKEAYLKGRGEGLSHPLHSFDVPLARMQSPQPVTTAGSGRWWLHSLEGIPGYVAALAIEGGPVRCLYRCLALRSWQAGGAVSNSPARWKQRSAAAASPA